MSVSGIGITVLVVISAISLWNLFEETAVRFLHWKGKQARAEILSVKRCLARDQKQRMLRGPDANRSYVTDCDYILTLRYSDEKRERVRKDVMIPARITVNFGVLEPCYEEGMEIIVKWHPWLPGKVVADSPEVRERQCRGLAYLVWLLAAVLCLSVFKSWIFPQ